MKESKITPEKQNLCSLCRVPLPDGASFCPHCARSIKPWTRQKAPKPLQKKFLHIAALVTALAVIARLHLTSCTVSGWKTGVLASGTTWVNAMDCRFEDNQVGFRFNAEGTVVTRTQYANNEFFHNGTAVLLKSVPAESPLSFPGSVFEDNDTDIDNRCGREVNISQTTFR